ncbi:MAG: hypothetical protein WCA19_13700 [Candidatus Acidiferrales bacterium]
MNYSKPEVKTLGEATVVIEGGKAQPISSDPTSVKLTPKPAYDLDE